MNKSALTAALSSLFCSGIMVASAMALEMVETTYPDGKLRERYFVTRTPQGGSLKDSVYREFYPNGKKKRAVFFRENRESGKAYTWYESGLKESECYYKNGELDGVKKVWYKSGRLKSRSTWSDGVLNGKNESWYENRKPRMLAYYLNGKANDEFKTWYDNGNQRSLSSFKNGTPVGSISGWHKNGGKAIVGYYNDEGQPEYIWQVFKEDGTKCAEIAYENGREKKKNYYTSDSVIDALFNTISVPKQ